MDRLIRDNRIGVLYSRSYGAGWYTVHKIKAAVFDPAIIGMVESHRRKDIKPYCEKKYGQAIYCGSNYLEVEWIEMDKRFTILSYMGYESIYEESKLEWFETARNSIRGG